MTSARSQTVRGALAALECGLLLSPILKGQPPMIYSGLKSVSDLPGWRRHVPSMKSGELPETSHTCGVKLLRGRKRKSRRLVLPRSDPTR